MANQSENSVLSKRFLSNFFFLFENVSKDSTNNFYLKLLLLEIELNSNYIPQVMLLSF